MNLDESSNMNNSIPSIRILPADISTVPTGVAESGKFLETLQQSMDQVEGAQGDAATQVAQLLEFATPSHLRLTNIEKRYSFRCRHPERYDMALRVEWTTDCAT